MQRFYDLVKILLPVMFPFLARANPEILSLKEIKVLTVDQQIAYINSLRTELGRTQKSQLITLNIKGTTCARKGMFQCHPGLYGRNLCVKYDIAANKQCTQKKAADLDILRHLGRQLDTQIPWGILRAETSAYCQKKENHQGCAELRQLASNYRQKIKL